MLISDSDLSVGRYMLLLGEVSVSVQYSESLYITVLNVCLILSLIFAGRGDDHGDQAKNIVFKH